MDNESSSFSIETDAESPSIVPPVLLCILGVAGNAIAVAVVFCAVKSDQWQPFYRFVCGLALTDGLGVMLGVPFAIHRYATDFEYTYSQTVCDYMAVVQMFTIIASAMIVCTMSLERFMAIVFPYVYKSIQKGSRSLVMLVCVWALSAFLSSGHLMAGRHSRLFYPDSWCFVNFVSDNSTDFVFSFLYALTGLFLLITTFVTNAILVVVIIKKKCSKSSSLTADRHGTHIILFLFSVVLLFSICILPILLDSSMMKKLLTLVLITRPNQVLLGMKKRGFGQGRWNGFGGKVEKGETILEAAKRELFEESSLKSDDLKEIGLIDFEFVGDPQILEVHVFTSSKFEGEPTESLEMRPQWFNVKDIPFDTMWPDDHLWFPLFLSGTKFKGYFLFEGHDKILKQTLDKVDSLLDE